MSLSRKAQEMITGAIAALVIIAISASIVFAQEITSSNFKVDNEGFTQLGGYSTTSNFSTFGSLDPIGNGDSTSTSFSLSSGYLYTTDSSPFASQNWQWFDDSYSGTPSIALASQNVAPSSIGYDDPVKLRITVKDISGGGISNVKLRLQYSTTTDFSSGTAFVGEQNTCDSYIWCYADGAGTDNQVISETVLTDPDFCSGGVGNGCGTYNESGTTTSPFFHWAGKKIEYEFTIKQTMGASSTVYFFRLVDAGTSIPIPTNTGKSYPSAVIAGGTLSFSIQGLTSGTSTEGITTDIATSPTSVSFGTLAINSPKVGAHRLIVTTNASSGYKVYAYQRQGLLSSSAREIPPVSTTNTSPAGWSTACSSSATGCYGYHTGEDVLEGGSTRFAADDSYAKFTTSPDEVAYSVGPATNVSTDIVYKIEARDLQDAGDYQSSIVYIATPIF